MANIYGIRFNQVNDYFSLEDNAAWDINQVNGDQFYAMWIEIENTSANLFQYLFSNNSFNAANSINIFLEGTGNPQVKARLTSGAINGATITVPSAKALVVFQWDETTLGTHLSVCLEGGTISRTSIATDLIGDIFSANWDLGRRTDGNVDRYYGGIIYNIAKGTGFLSDANIESLASDFLVYDKTVLDAVATTEIFFPMNEGTGSDITDDVLGLTGTGIGFTGSQWVLAESVGGPANYTATFSTSYDLYTDKLVAQSTSFDLYNDHTLALSTSYDLTSSHTVAMATLFDLYTDLTAAQVTTYDLFSMKIVAQSTAFDLYSDKSVAQVTTYDLYSDHMYAFVTSYELDAGGMLSRTVTFSTSYDLYADKLVAQQTQFDLYNDHTEAQQTLYDLYNDKIVVQSTAFDLYNAKTAEIAALFSMYNEHTTQVVTSFDLYNDRTQLQITSFDVYASKTFGQTTYYDLGATVLRAIAKRKIVVQNKRYSYTIPTSSLL